MSADTEIQAAPARGRSAHAGGRSFFLRYLGRELGRRARQATVIALGLALGIGLVITVSAAAAGVKNAQASVLHSLYGVGTDLTVTQQPKSGSNLPGQNKVGISIQGGPGQAPTVCVNGKCKSGAQTLDNLISAPTTAPLRYADIDKIAKLAHVKAAAGGLTMNDNQVTLSSNSLSPPTQFSVQGIDLAHENLGPLSSGTLSSGRTFRATDATSRVALVDANYAKSRKLKVGSKITIAKHKFTIIGVVTQPQAASPPQVYVPLAVAQALGTQGPDGKSLKGYVNTIYVTTASAADISAVQQEIKKLLPSATVTTASSLASEVTGSLSNTAKLANDLGKWLSILVLIAAFAVASLLTIAAVSRRVREFGTLKALGWRSRRIVSQVMGESVTLGIIGGAAGVGLGFAGAALITKIAPKLSAIYATATGQRVETAGPGGSQSFTPTASHTVSVPLHASVTVGVIVLAVALAVAGGLLAGTFGSWRIGRLRPAAALARVE